MFTKKKYFSKLLVAMLNPKEVLFLINPHAGKGETESHLRNAARTLLDIEVKSFAPSTPEEMTNFCAALDPKVTRAVVVIGGDGTQNHAIRGLSQSGVPLYPFPAGTANDLAYEHGIKKNWSQLQDLLSHSSFQEMDLIAVNGVPFATVAGIGIGSQLTSEYNSLRSRSPFFKKISQKMSSEVYTLLSVKSIFKNWGGSLQIKIHADQYQEKIDTAALFICNQSSMGGGIRVAPEISNRDHRFSVLILPYSNGFSMLQALSTAKRGKLSSRFISFSTSNLEITSLNGEPLKVFGDGETLVTSEQLEFKIHPHSLKIFNQEGHA